MRLSVTLLESYRLFKTQDWMSFDDFASSVRKDVPPTVPMIRGRAFHSILEDPTAHRLHSDYYEAEGITFDRRSIDELRALLPVGTPEVKTEERIAGHTVVGKCDSMTGLDLDEYKLTSRISPDKYLDSYQWRYYLELFGAERCTFHVVQFYEGEPIKLGQYLPLTMVRYPGLLNDCKRLVHECAEFIALHNLDGYVLDKAA